MVRFGSALAAAFVVVPLVASSASAQVNPVVNGDFELMLPPEATGPLAGTPVDTCIGIGHQIFYGDETVQHKVVDEGDPEAAATQIADDPQGEVLFLAGVDHCVFSGEDGIDLVWLAPGDRARQPLQWSIDVRNPSATFGDFDDSGDFEAKITADGTLASHNMWQAFPNPHQAFTANFDRLRFVVEEGSIPTSASVILSLSTNPLRDVNDRLVLELDCSLTFRKEHLTPDANGVVEANPANAVLSARDDVCEDEENAFNDPNASEADKRTVLDGLRIVQHSYWSFNQGDEDVVLDDVEMTGARTIVEAAAGL